MAMANIDVENYKNARRCPDQQARKSDLQLQQITVFHQIKFNRYVRGDNMTAQTFV